MQVLKVRCMKDLPFQTAFGKKRSCDLDFTGQVSLTKQSFTDDCDINNILKRYETTGVIEHGSSVEPRYGDFSGYDDYHSACMRVIEAQDNFMALPAKVRARFQNDPGLFLDFVMDPGNVDELREMGLMNSKEPAVVEAAASAAEG